ncbi:MAG: YfiR family protein, partial [Limisphaerales bacterium]
MAFLTLHSHRLLSSGGLRQGRRRFLASLIALSVALGGAERLIAQDSPEYQIKAVFLYNFAQFVSWPEEAFNGKEDPFVIGVIGKDPFGSSLDETVRNERINGRRMEVRRYRSVEEVKGCQILFISASEQPRLFQILDALEGRPTLTVGDTENFARNGGMIRFLSERNKIRFRINLQAAQ